MTCAGKITTFGPVDFLSAGPETPYFGCSTGSISSVSGSVTITKSNSILTSIPLQTSLDVGRRVPSSRMSARMPLLPGSYSISSSVSSTNGAANDSVSLTVFEEPVVVSANDQTALNTALSNFKISSGKHLKIILASGSYVYPVGSQYDLSTLDKLVSFESRGTSILASTNPINVKYAHWYKMLFSNSVGPAFTAGVGSVNVFKRCQFSSSVIGLLSPIGSYTRVEDCHAHSLTTGFVNVDVVRGLSWTKISGVVFYDCSVIESTIGRRAITVTEVTSALKKQCVWAVFDKVRSNISVKDNLLLDDYSTIILSDGSISNALIVGNTFVTTGRSCIQSFGLVQCFVANNTVVSPNDVPTLQAQSSTKNCIVNNYFTRMDSSSRSMADTGVWSNNAISYGSKFGSSLVAEDPVFVNNYKLLGVTSPLKNTGTQVYGYQHIQGLPVAGQIGSMPYHPDKSLSHIYFQMRGDSFFGFSMPAVVIS